MTDGDPVDLVRTVCLGLPGTTEKLSHGAPSFFAGRQYLTVWADGHHDHHFPHLWAAAPDGAQEALVAEHPERYFRPPYVGHRGWIGLRLDAGAEPDEVADVCRQAWEVVRRR